MFLKVRIAVTSLGCGEVESERDTSGGVKRVQHFWNVLLWWHKYLFIMTLFIIMHLFITYAIFMCVLYFITKKKKKKEKTPRPEGRGRKVLLSQWV